MSGVAGSNPSVSTKPDGQPWGQFTAALINGCKDVIRDLTFGQHVEVTLQGFPFRVRISRHRKSAGPVCLVMRFAPNDVVADLARVLPDVIVKPNKQLTSYKHDGYPTILLLDTDDFVLITRPQVAEAFARWAAQSQFVAIDEVFVAETCRKPAWIYPVKVFGQVYPDLPEYRRFLDAQYRLTYGDASFSS